jgi:hypothetical protein
LYATPRFVKAKVHTEPALSGRDTLTIAIKDEALDPVDQRQLVLISGTTSCVVWAHAGSLHRL